ncbi:MAG: hypothetical protein ACRD19_12890, partial [Terriglobia bacterium]
MNSIVAVAVLALIMSARSADADVILPSAQSGGLVIGYGCLEAGCSPSAAYTYQEAYTNVSGASVNLTATLGSANSFGSISVSGGTDPSVTSTSTLVDLGNPNSDATLEYFFEIVGPPSSNPMPVLLTGTTFSNSPCAGAVAYVCGETAVTITPSSSLSSLIFFLDQTGYGIGIINQEGDGSEVNSSSYEFNEVLELEVGTE